MISHMEKKRTYIAIDLKSFYASVECQLRGLDPLETNLVVADESKTEKTICLAVSPSLKQYGIGGRARLFEVNQKVKQINRERSKKIHYQDFVSSSINAQELIDPYLELDFLIAPPQMATYIEYSTRIYNIYLRYISKDDIHVYSIDEVFIDATDYLKIYQMNAHDFARMLIQQVLKETGITATAGIGDNLFLCKVAMDIVAKHIPGDKDGVRIAQLDESSYRKLLWTHRPLTDFWRIGKGTENRLAKVGIYTMGDIARCSLGKFSDYYNEDLLYQIFGINAELIIDHAWGYESCTLKDIKAYKPTMHSYNVGQVMTSPHDYESTKTVIKEMCEELSLKLVKNHKNTDGLGLVVGYDVSSLTDDYDGEVVVDWYGRVLPKQMSGFVSFSQRTSTISMLSEAAIKIYESNINKKLMMRRINLYAPNLKDDSCLEYEFTQTDLFDSSTELPRIDITKEKNVEQAILEIKRRYGKNAIVKGMDLTDGATTKERNEQIGGHKA